MDNNNFDNNMNGQENPYQQGLKLQDSTKYAGNNIDFTL